MRCTSCDHRARTSTCTSPLAGLGYSRAVASRKKQAPEAKSKRAAAPKKGASKAKSPAKPAPKSPKKSAAKAKPAVPVAAMTVPPTTAREGEPRYWLIKSEPTTYPWSRLVADGRTTWDGVRSFEARNNLRAMQLGDLALFYHSNDGKDIVGVARIVRTAYPDSSAPDGDWSVVELSPVVSMQKPVSLATIKATPALAKMELVAKMRLSVTKVSLMEFAKILVMGETSIP